MKAKTLSGLFGTHRFVIDDKGRLQIPAQFRRLMPDEEPRNLVMTQGPGGCIYAFHPRVWDRYMRRLRQMDVPAEKKLPILRRILAPAQNCSIDSQWRVKPPDDLARYAALDREIVIFGQIDRFEIWNPERRAEVLARDGVDYDAVSTELFVGGMPDDGGVDDILVP